PVPGSRGVRGRRLRPLKGSRRGDRGGAAADRRQGGHAVGGFSGFGKTSLLRAGLFPRLREADIFPVYIRLCYAHASDGREAAADASVLREQCFEAIRQAAARWRYEVPAQSASGTLWEYVRRRNDRF